MAKTKSTPEQRHRYYLNRIEKYGREKYNEASSIANKKYREKHKKEIAERTKKYSKEHKEKIKEYKQKYRKEHKEELAYDKLKRRIGGDMEELRKDIEKTKKKLERLFRLKRELVSQQVYKLHFRLSDSVMKKAIDEIGTEISEQILKDFFAQKFQPYIVIDRIEGTSNEFFCTTDKKWMAEIFKTKDYEALENNIEGDLFFLDIYKELEFINN